MASRARLLRYVGHWELLGFGFWVVREKSTGRNAASLHVAHKCGFRELSRVSYKGEPILTFERLPGAR